MGAAATTMLLKTGWPLIAAIGPVYTIGLMVIVYSSGRAFMLRKCVELALEERPATVSLLLRDYENSDGDWPWEHNGNPPQQSVAPPFHQPVVPAPLHVESQSLLTSLSRRHASAPPQTTDQ